MISLRLNLTKVELEVMIHEVEVELEDIISKVFRPLKPWMSLVDLIFDSIEVDLDIDAIDRLPHRKPVYSFDLPQSDSS